MKIHSIRAQDLAAVELAAWARIRAGNPELHSPYFAPEFTRVVAEIRDDVEIAVFEDAGEPVGFLPFQRATRRVGIPLGGQLSDFQGVIAPAGFDFSPRELLRACGLQVFEFDHWLASQSPLLPHAASVAGSPYLDLSEGFDAYFEERRSAGSHELRQTLRKARKLEREVGAVRLELRSKDPRALAALIEWKSAQYRETGAVPLFAHRWTLDLLERVRQERGEGFEGLLSVLWAGERIAAVHLGMLSCGVLHWWFPAYEPALSVHSPGRILLVELARASAELGALRIDLGKGAARYKDTAASGEIQVAEGSLHRHALIGRLRHGVSQLGQRVRALPLPSALRSPARALYRAGRSWRLR